MHGLARELGVHTPLRGEREGAVLERLDVNTRHLGLERIGGVGSAGTARRYERLGWSRSRARATSASEQS